MFARLIVGDVIRIGIAALILAYVLSQFYRAFLAVLAPILAVDLNASAEALAQASGWWFLTFALMQVPVGWALLWLPRRGLWRGVWAPMQ